MIVLQLCLRTVLSFLMISGVALGAASPLIVNIDNPQFRRTVSAIPRFIVCKDSHKDPVEALSLAKEGSEELKRLLSFTGLFNHIAPAAYQETLNVLVKSECRGQKSIFSQPDVALPEQWKSMGVESLTIGKVLQTSGGLVIEMQTIDVNRRKVLLGKRFGGINSSEIKAIMRRYGNLLLEVYTGKPGIFLSKITFVGREKKGEDKQVYICDFDGSNVKRITSGKVPHLSPHWSPDNKYITYTSYERGNPDLFLYDLSTQRKRLISNHPGLNSGAQWSPTGKIVAYTGSKNGDSDIFYLDPFNGQRRALIRGGGLDVDPTFSPDGKFLAFVSGRYGNPHIFLASLRWDNPLKIRVMSDRRLTYAGWYNSTPSWSPDSEQIIFAGYDKDINRYDIFMMDKYGKQLERLTLKTGDNENPSFSPNGQLVVFQSNRIGHKNIKGRYHLWVMRKDGSGQVKINTGLYESLTPDWSGPGYALPQK